MAVPVTTTALSTPSAETGTELARLVWRRFRSPADDAVQETGFASRIVNSDRRGGSLFLELTERQTAVAVGVLDAES